MTVLYTLLVGEFVYSDRQPSDSMAAVICEFFAGAHTTVSSCLLQPCMRTLHAMTSGAVVGTCYTTIVARLFSIATGVSAQRKGARTVSMLLFFGYSTSATFVATLRGDQQGKGADVKFLPLFLVSERVLKVRGVRGADGGERARGGQAAE